jgi:quercetin dioxygenase-like cupin family protein
MKTELPVVLTSAASAPSYRAFGDEITFLLTGEQTGGQYTLFLETTPPGSGPPPHWHENEDEIFHVLEGRVSFFADGKWTETGPGTSVFAPRKSVHTFKNTGDQPCRMVITTSPAGFEKFFTQAAEVFAKPGAPNVGRAIAIANEHGIYFV